MNEWTFLQEALVNIAKCLSTSIISWQTLTLVHGRSPNRRYNYYYLNASTYLPKREMKCCLTFKQTWKIGIFTHLKLCLATATHNFKWVKITDVILGKRWSGIFALQDSEILAIPHVPGGQWITHISLSTKRGRWKASLPTAGEVFIVHEKLSTILAVINWRMAKMIETKIW